MNVIEIVLAAQTARKIVAIIDMARVFDVNVARAAGVDIERLLISTPDTAPQAHEIAETLARSGAVEVLVIVGAMAARPLARVREVAAKTGTEVVVIEAERAPEPPCPKAALREISKAIRVVDRAAVKTRQSRAQHTSDRAELLLLSPLTRPVHYGLAWGLSTGRLSLEMEEVLRTMSPTTLAKAALSIAEKHGRGSVKDVYEAWREVLMPAS